MSDGLNAGLPSDRFQVEWWITSERVQRFLAGMRHPSPLEPVHHVSKTSRTAGGLLAPGCLSLNVAAGTVMVEVPADYQSIKTADLGLALEWRLATRTVFETYFAGGYSVVDFASSQVQGERRSYYVLCRS
jgi:predicted GNAT superfamily acetyltransferase